MLLIRRSGSVPVRTMGSTVAAAEARVAELDRQIRATEDGVRANVRAQRELGPKLKLDVTPEQRQQLEGQYRQLGENMTHLQQKLSSLRQQRAQAVAAIAAARDAEELARLRAAEQQRAAAETPPAAGTPAAGTPAAGTPAAPPAAPPTAETPAAGGTAAPTPDLSDVSDLLELEGGGLLSNRTLLIGGAVAGAVLLVVLLRPRGRKD